MNIYEFKLGKKMGAGKFGGVCCEVIDWLFRHIKTEFMVAIKLIDKTKIDHKLFIQLIREIKIQTFLNQPNIVRLYAFFSDELYI